MKKILFGLLVLSSLSFAHQQYHNNTNHAGILIEVSANVNTGDTIQLYIVDPISELPISSLNLNHENLNITNLNGHSYSTTFKVKRGKDNGVDFPTNSTLTFALNDEAIPLSYTDAQNVTHTFSAFLTTPTYSEELIGNITNPITLTSHLSSSNPNLIVDGTYTGNTSLNVYLNK